MAMLTANWTRLKMVGNNKILTWTPWRHIVEEANLKSFYPKTLLQENVDPKYLLSELVSTVSWDVIEESSWFQLEGARN